MEKLDGILDAYVTKGDKTTKDELLGAAFVVVNKDGEAPLASCLSSSLPLWASKPHSLTEGQP